MSIQVCVTKDDVELAKELIQEAGGEFRSYCCPNAVAICRAMGIDPRENVQEFRVEVERKAVAIFDAHRVADQSADLPEPAREVVKWFDLDEPEPEWPVCYGLDLEVKS